MKGIVNVTADGLDSDSGIKKIEFYHSSPMLTLIGTDTTAPYSMDWDTTTGVVDGHHSLYIKVYDNAGNQSTYISLPVTVDNTSPTITLLGDATVNLTVGTAYIDA